MAISQQIIALGGGGFSMESENLALDRYILSQTNKSSPKVCFVPTASGDSDNYIRRFYESFTSLDCRPRHLALFQRLPGEGLESFVLDHDVVYAGGGSTRNLLAVWRDWELDRIFQTALRRGVILAGLSAGSICWFEQGVTDSMSPFGSDRMASLDCLGFLAGSNCPHYDGEANRRPEYHRLLLEGEICAGWAADDGVALHFVDGSLQSVVSSREAAYAYRVERRESEVHEERLETQYLGSA